MQNGAILQSSLSKGGVEKTQKFVWQTVNNRDMYNRTESAPIPFEHPSRRAWIKWVLGLFCSFYTPWFSSFLQGLLSSNWAMMTVQHGLSKNSRKLAGGKCFELANLYGSSRRPS
jgi:hypothetical protein